MKRRPFVFDQRGDLHADAFDQYVKNKSHDMKNVDCRHGWILGPRSRARN